MNNVFVYGTLMFPELIKALTGKNFKMQNAILENYSRHQIFDNNIPREYPAIIPNPNHQVEGKIIFNIDKTSQQILDFYEGDEYKKELLNVETKNGLVNAFVYTWHPITNCEIKENWNPDIFKCKFLTDYINIVAPEVLRDFKLI